MSLLLQVQRPRECILLLRKLFFLEILHFLCIIKNKLLSWFTLKFILKLNSSLISVFEKYCEVY